MLTRLQEVYFRRRKERVQCIACLHLKRAGTHPSWRLPRRRESTRSRESESTALRSQKPSKYSLHHFLHPDDHSHPESIAEPRPSFLQLNRRIDCDSKYTVRVACLLLSIYVSRPTFYGLKRPQILHPSHPSRSIHLVAN
jgi:hypothetical protein